MIIDKNLVPFLQFREQILDISDLEEKYGFILPPIYRAFITTFQPSFSHIKFKAKEVHSSIRDGFGSFVVVIYPKEKKEYYTVEDDLLCLDSFLEVEEVLSFRQRAYTGWTEDVLFIGDHGYWGGLMVGIGAHNADKIYHYDSSAKMKYIAKNIFSLIKEMQLVKYDHIPFLSVDTTKLYKKWGENFWRIQDEDID